MFRRLLIASVALLLPFAGAATARADEVASRCSGRVIEQPFAQFGDLADYFLAPDGDLSAGGAGWERRGAEVVAENEPFWVHGGDTPAAVWLDSGASATSPPICVTLDDPTMRFFARSAGGPSGQLAVDVLYTDADGTPQERRIGTVGADEAQEWAPVAPLAIVANTTEMDVRFRFTAVGAGSEWLIDDVFVDPYKKG
jgi:hypothetical protein